MPGGVCVCGGWQVLEGETGRVSPTQRSSLLTGTFAYRAPELLRGESPDTKADIYSLGVTMWHMEARRTPYAGHEPHAVVFNVVAYHARPTVRQPLLHSLPLTHTHTHTPLQRPFVRDYPGEPVPER